MSAPCNGPNGERERLFAEIAILKGERDGLMAQLAECRRQVRQLQSQLSKGGA
jgi:uncharacterized coiled-coil DUF342 family protein